MTKQALLIFAKNPESGKVKTRLAATIGNEEALEVYTQLLEHTLSVTKYLPVDKYVFYGDHIQENDIWDSNQYFKQFQEGNDLGERMNNAFAFAFDHGYTEVVIIGTDCYELCSITIINAFSGLKKCEIVIGPSKDGGYYLLGVKQMHHQLFENINWSTAEVLKKTLAVCETHKLSLHLLSELSDIDNENDLNEALAQGLKINCRKV